MIPNQWYVILEGREVRPGRPLGVTRMGERLALWRDEQGKLQCRTERCPHRGAALSGGEILGGEIACPFHGFQFDGTGCCRLVPANGRAAQPPKAMQARAYPVREAHGFVYLWWGEPRASYPPLPWFSSIDESFSYATVRDLWATHYSRAIENQLDVVHLPFVHRSTIGRGNRTLVNGPLARLEPEAEGDRLDLWVNNEIDRGQKPLSLRQMAEPKRRPFLQFRFPNLWQNWISDSFRVLVAFAPVDDEHTLLYLRGYQNFMRTPGLRTGVNLLAAVSNLVVERQDKRVVEEQLPKRSELHMGEKLIQGDWPIILYRRRREELICAAEQQAIPAS